MLAGIVERVKGLGGRVVQIETEPRQTAVERHLRRMDHLYSMLQANSVDVDYKIRRQLPFWENIMTGVDLESRLIDEMTERLSRGRTLVVAQKITIGLPPLRVW